MLQAQSVGLFAWCRRLRFNGDMTPPFLTILTGRGLPKIGHAQEAAPSTINEKTVADFTRVVEQTGILDPTRRQESSDGH
jgi:hypothetical protein